MKNGALIRDSFVGFIKTKKNALAVAVAVLGLLLIVFSMLGGGDGTDKGEVDSLKEYQLALEGELASLCSSVYGAGKCVVRVSFSEGERLEYKGSTLIGKIPPKVEGVTVLCRGGDSATVKSEITDAISALFGIGKNRICVLKLSS